MKYFPLLLLFLLGCVSTQSLPVESRSRVYDLDYDLVFDATVQMLSEEGFAIIDAQRDAGVINTDYRADDGSFLDFLFRNANTTRRKISALVSNAPNGTRVLLNFDLQEFTDPLVGNGTYRSVQLSPSTARKYYRDFFKNLNAYLEVPSPS